MYPRGRGKPRNWVPPERAPPPWGPRPPRRFQDPMPPNDNFAFDNKQQSDFARMGLKRPSRAPWINQNHPKNFDNPGNIWAPNFQIDSFNEVGMPKRFRYSDNWGANAGNMRAPFFQPRGFLNQGPLHRPQHRGFPSRPPFFNHPDARFQLGMNISQIIDKMQQNPADKFQAGDKSQTTEGGEYTDSINFPQDPEFLFEPATTVTTVMMGRISQTVGTLTKELKNTYRITNYQAKGLKQIVHTRLVEIMTGKPLHDEHEMYNVYREHYPTSSDPTLFKSLGFGRIVKKSVVKEENPKANDSENEATKSAATKRKKSEIESSMPKKGSVLKRAVTKLCQQMEGKMKLSMEQIDLFRTVLCSRLRIIIAKKAPGTVRELCEMYRKQYEFPSDAKFIQNMSADSVEATAGSSLKGNEDETGEGTTNVDTNDTIEENSIHSPQRFKEDMKQHTRKEVTNFKEQKKKLQTVIERKVEDIFSELIKLLKEKTEMVGEDQSDYERTDDLIPEDSFEINSNGHSEISEVIETLKANEKDIDLSNASTHTGVATENVGIGTEDIKSEETANGSKIINERPSKDISDTYSESDDDDEIPDVPHISPIQEDQLEKSLALIIPTMLTRFKPHLIQIINKERELVKAGMPTSWMGPAPFCPKSLQYVKIFGRPTLPSVKYIREFLEFYDPSVLLELRFKADGPSEALFVGIISKPNWRRLASQKTIVIDDAVIGVCRVTTDVLYKYRNFLKNIDLWNPTTENKVSQTELEDDEGTTNSSVEVFQE